VLVPVTGAFRLLIELQEPKGSVARMFMVFVSIGRLFPDSIHRLHTYYSLVRSVSTCAEGGSGFLKKAEKDQGTADNGGSTLTRAE
jgi:hypothetical protein